MEIAKINGKYLLSPNGVRHYSEHFLFHLIPTTALCNRDSLFPNLCLGKHRHRGVSKALHTISKLIDDSQDSKLGHQFAEPSLLTS